MWMLLGVYQYYYYLLVFLNIISNVENCMRCIWLCDSQCVLIFIVLSISVSGWGHITLNSISWRAAKSLTITLNLNGELYVSTPSFLYSLHNVEPPSSLQPTSRKCEPCVSSANLSYAYTFYSCQKTKLLHNACTSIGRHAKFAYWFYIHLLITEPLVLNSANGKITHTHTHKPNPITRRQNLCPTKSSNLACVTNISLPSPPVTFKMFAPNCGTLAPAACPNLTEQLRQREKFDSIDGIFAYKPHQQRSVHIGSGRLSALLGTASAELLSTKRAAAAIGIRRHQDDGETAATTAAADGRWRVSACSGSRCHGGSAEIRADVRSVPRAARFKWEGATYTSHMWVHTH